MIKKAEKINFMGSKNKREKIKGRKIKREKRKTLFKKKKKPSQKMWHLYTKENILPLRKINLRSCRVLKVIYRHAFCSERDSHWRGLNMRVSGAPQNDHFQAWSMNISVLPGE